MNSKLLYVHSFRWKFMKKLSNLYLFSFFRIFNYYFIVYAYFTYAVTARK